MFCSNTEMLPYSFIESGGCVFALVFLYSKCVVTLSVTCVERLWSSTNLTCGVSGGSTRNGGRSNARGAQDVVRLFCTALFLTLPQQMQPGEQPPGD